MHFHCCIETPLCKKSSIYFVTDVWIVLSSGHYKLCYDGHSCMRLLENTFLLGKHQEAGLLGQRAESSAEVCTSHCLHGKNLGYGAK